MNQVSESRKRTVVAKSSSIQQEFPYLMKKSFVPVENASVNIARYQYEGEKDPLLHKFQQSENNYRVKRLQPGESITRKNPLAGIKEIKVCNSF